jgi:hypothetical protein
VVVMAENEKRYVIAFEPAIIPHGNAKGRKTEKILRRLWSDDTEDFMCANDDCEFARPTYGPVMAHRSSHRRLTDPPPTQDVHALLRRIERDVAMLRTVISTGAAGTWRTRALEAERKLAGIKRGLQ